MKFITVFRNLDFCTLQSISTIHIHFVILTFVHFSQSVQFTYISPATNVTITLMFIIHKSHIFRPFTCHFQGV